MIEDQVVHEYDDIRECDNQLPRWWVYILIGTVVFAAGYWFYYQVYGTGDSPLAVYQKEKAAAQAAQLKAEGALTPERLVAMSHNAAIVGEGKVAFSQLCASCHGAQGGGQIGPNLTDEYWLWGGKPDDIFKTIRDGHVDKGMPAWGPQIGEPRVRVMAAYVLSIKDTHVANGKAPQGKKEL